ncbi:copper chaperone [Trinickia sp.]|uniref:copper chaperone n=1 Tax=Trinickia sp. TaxID=2571163 RepID=UPI003F7F1DC6
MPDIPMPGDWALSSMWMPASTCGQTWIGSAAAFVAMWTVMMIPMMLPSLTPALWVHWMHARGIVGRRAAWSTLLVGFGYFAFWLVLGVVVFAVGAALSAGLLRSTVLARSMPVVSGVVIVLAGCVQFTPWKAGRLACCRTSPLDGFAPVNKCCAAFRYGFALAVHSGVCCANWMAVLFSIGIMDPRAMLTVTVAMLIEQRVKGHRPPLRNPT